MKQADDSMKFKGAKGGKGAKKKGGKAKGGRKR